MSKHYRFMIVPVMFGALAVSACVSQSEYDDVVMQNEKLEKEIMSLEEQNTALKLERAEKQEAYRWVQAGDLLFPEGGWKLSAEGEQELNKLVPILLKLSNSKVVVYGYTDDTPIGPNMKSEGIETNMDLSLRRAGTVANYLISQGVDPDIVSAKGRGETHPVAPNDSDEGRAANRRIEIVITGVGT